MCLQVKQARTAARYEKMVLRANEWMVEQGYAAFCEVVEESETRYTVKLCLRSTAFRKFRLWKLSLSS